MKLCGGGDYQSFTNIRQTIVQKYFVEYIENRYEIIEY